MRFYKDIIDQVEETATNNMTKYHEWSPQSIELYWNICTGNPLIRRQFYPMEYWEDLLGWAAAKINLIPRTIVDVGCGNGNLINRISEIYKEATIYGVDLSEEAMTSVKKRYEKHENICFRVGSLDRLPFEDRSIDVLTCTEVLEHTFPETFSNSFSEVGRVLKNGGYYLASVPFNEEMVLVPCPGCGSIFTPYQHMTFEISHKDILRLLCHNGLELVAFYQSFDRTQPKNRVKRVLKSFLVKGLPVIASRIFPKAGVSGLLARNPRKDDAER